MTIGPATSGPKPPFAERVASLRGSPIGELDALIAGRTGVIPLAGGTPHVDDIEHATIARLLTSAVEVEPRLLLYGLTEGDLDVRDALVEFASGTGDGHPSAGELIVTSGATQGLDLLAKLFVDPGDLVLVESPTFTDALATFSAYQANVVEVPMDEHGIVVDAIPELVTRQDTSPKLIYVVPTFQNPTGVTMSEDRRHALLALSRRYGSVIVDDDPYRLLRYRGSPIPSLRSLAEPSDAVVATRSASKLIAPGLRVGWALGPAEIIAQMARAKQGMDICTSSIAQRAVAGMLGDGFHERLDRLIGRYAARLAATTQALEREFAGTGVSWEVPDGGYFVWIALPADRSATRLLELAIEEGVTFVPGDAFSPGRRFGSRLRLCFVAVREDDLVAGVARLRAAYERATEEAP